MPGRYSSPLALCSGPKTIAVLVFLLLYSFAILYYRTHSFRDPTSAFFDPVRGYDQIYSVERQAQAEHFIAAANNLTGKSRPSAGPTLCLGVATVSRPSRQYIRKTVGSLLQGLRDAERDSLHFVFFIAHTDQTAHPVHGEKWTETLPDTRLSYAGVDAAQLDAIRGWETSGNHRAKGLYDYARLLRACHSTGAPYIAMLEGDVLAVEGWYPRAVSAARTVDASSSTDDVPANTTTTAPGDAPAPAWLYIRMFHTEAYLGWNREEWPQYLASSVLVLVVVDGALLVARALSHRLGRVLTNPFLALVSLVFLPAAITLYFLGGRVTQQAAATAPGVRRMDNFGCCSQGMIFARAAVPLLLDSIAHPPFEYVDMLLEAVAAARGLQRWAIFPSLLQHIGGESSKGDAAADSRARMIWSFGFEMYSRAKHGAAGLV